MEQQTVPQGFEQNQQQHLASKQKDRQRQTNLYFKIPQAKPLLSKVSIDHQKPKILLRGLKVDLTYPQLLQAPLLSVPINFQRQGRFQLPSGQSNLWKRFIVSGLYKCNYMKYQNSRLEEGQRKGKRLRAEFQRKNYNNQWLIATHVVDMTFLSQTTSLMARNLTQNTLKQQYQRLSQLRQPIVFDSAYQNGNLMFAFSKEDNQQPRQFTLILQNDINTKGYANWFNFKVYSVEPGPLLFHIVNLQKIFSFFNHGMKPAVYSLQQSKGWRMLGHNISYNKGDILKTEKGNEKYSTMSFTIDQKHPNDLLVIAAACPYTYSHLLKFINQLQNKIKNRSNIYYKRGSLDKSISGNDCPLITVTSKRDRREETGRKRIVVIIARQHPSEVVSSWVAEGVLSSLLEDKKQSQQLLKKYIFKIVPMVNIDGVIYGNSRCDISGSDCNRKWSKNANPTLFPIVTAIRNLVTELICEGYEIEYFLDLHGHSRKLGSFMYCCKSGDQIQSRIFSWLMSKITDMFAFEECRFGISMFRRETARGYFGTLLTNHKAITLQTSYFGYRTATGFKAFTPEQLRQLGSSLMLTVHADTFRINGIVNWATVRNQIKQSMLRKRQPQQEQSSGSDSDPQGDEFSPAEKAQTFLSPSLASKIGLIDIKVIEKPKRSPHYRSSLKSNSPSISPRKQEEARNVLSPMEKVGLDLIKSQSLVKHGSTHEFKRGILGLRQNKSVTKIQPFKFRSLEKKQSGKRIRIAIDVQRLQSKQPGNSGSVFPAVRTRNRSEFWGDLQHEYQTLLTEKKAIIAEAKHFMQIQRK